MLVRDLVQAMDQIAPLREAEPWDNVGLILGDPAGPLSRVMLCIDLTPEVIAEAAGHRCEAVVVAQAEFLERYEGMLVRLPQTMYVTEHFLLGRFGQITISAGSRLDNPTAVVEPGAPALALQVANDLRKIILDDGNNLQNQDPIVFGRGGQPLSASNTLRGGDTATGIVGVLDWAFGGDSNASPNAWRVRPVNALGGSVDFQPTNPRPGPSVEHDGDDWGHEQPRRCASGVDDPKRAEVGDGSQS